MFGIWEWLKSGPRVVMSSRVRRDIHITRQRSLLKARNGTERAKLDVWDTTPTYVCIVHQASAVELLGVALKHAVLPILIYGGLIRFIPKVDKTRL